MSRLFYLSFAEAEPPVGRGFLGAVIVEAFNAELAVERATRLNLNPGGEIAIVEMKAAARAEPKFDLYFHRLMTAAEIRASAEEVARLDKEVADLEVVCEDCNPARRH